MAIIKYNPVLRDRVPGTFPSLFDKFFYDNLEDSSVKRFLPSADILENEKAYVVNLSVPGLNKSDFEIDLEDGKLIITGERKFEEVEGINYHRQEIQYGSFKRVFHLPEDADKNGISANYKNGILTISIKKDEKKILKQKIEVK
ncbi:Hsp20/alpha crystallin family protein [Bacteroidota bacterium]